jgi:hypothetical protein
MMNEKIVELAEQAGQESFDTEYTTLLQVSTEDTIYEVPAGFIAKFAELIIRECIGICVSNALDDLDTDNPRGASAKCAFDIKEHFGVEE